ncbi:MAG: protein-methionine-sulfoxide reductase catalytic subunit MsrP, partial [Pseudomonadota bacterium]
MPKYSLPADMVTPKSDWLNRRAFIASLGASAIAGPSLATTIDGNELEPTSWDAITKYNNFYEFGTGKSDPFQNADALTTDPWSIEIGGLVANPIKMSFEDLISEMPMVDRIYRFRCVEAWSSVVPWNGFELARLLEKVEPTEEAKYVAFETLYRPDEMPGQRRDLYPWPYVEGLRLDEAMHPLTLLATGVYGEPMPNQKGAPIRLVVPWKYGFKSIKSIVKITLTAEEPPTTWNVIQPREYGFYSNVNPRVDHPRWSQATERPIGKGLFAPRQETLMFNGYEEHVASLYEGMDLTKF